MYTFCIDTRQLARKSKTDSAQKNIDNAWLKMTEKTTREERQATYERTKGLMAVDNMSITPAADDIFQRWINGEITEEQRRFLIIDHHKQKIKNSN